MLVKKQIKNPTAQQPYSKQVYFHNKISWLLDAHIIYSWITHFLWLPTATSSVSFACIPVHQLDPCPDSWFFGIFSTENPLQRLSRV